MGKNNKHIIIAGPCAIETKKIFFDTIDSINKDVDIFRAGIWKARTSPNNFQGIGEEGLSWIQEAQIKYKKPFAIEVGTAQHVELALKHEIGILWIGARTTCNPFSVQEICEATRGSDLEIWIKNPIFPNLELWIGAIERFKKSKIKNIKVINRGFFSESPSPYRNLPRWDIVRKFKKIFPKIPLICDPSHISGNTELIYDVCVKALSYEVIGFMIEVHKKPEIALSDQNQQLKPKEFCEILDKLKSTNST
ncbi:MAG: hypothetical protein CMP65_01715 [Flavobacteriales bacterium]|nr:hypothetical protein [Flavobacteriales bacterium]|tara:strand:- start:22307 stop:23059 length:753 start_codon:yes stop_codon:yes gene_type:complete